MRETKICIVLDDWEYGTFITGKEEKEFAELGKISHVEAKSFAGGEGWRKYLEEERPEILVTGWMTPKLPEDTLTWLPELKYVCHLAGSVKGFLPNQLIEDGLLVTNWGNSVSRTVAECGLMLAIGGLRRVSQWTIDMHQRGKWKDRTNIITGSLFDRNVGLHGFGVIARELTKLLKPFNVKISTYSPSVSDDLLEEYSVNRAESLEELFSKNDVVIELAALTDQTRGVVTEQLLRSIPAGGVFVNIGRGAVVDEAALARVADDGHIQVALDVYTVEPLATDSPLRANENVLILPHLGGPSIDRRPDATKLGLENIRHFLNGEPLEAQITPSIYARIT